MLFYSAFIMSLSHGVKKKTPCLPLSGFYLIRLLFYNKYFILLLLRSDCCGRLWISQSKLFLSTHGCSNLILLFIFVYMWFYGVFNRSTMALRNYESIIPLLHSFQFGLSSITWNNKEIVVKKLQIVVVFLVSEETTFKVDTTSITLSYLHPFGKEIIF